MRNFERFLVGSGQNGVLAAGGLFGLFTDEYPIDPRNLYFAHFKKVPHWIKLRRVDCKKASEWLVSSYKDNLFDHHIIKKDTNGGKGQILEITDSYYYLLEDLLVYFDWAKFSCYLFYRDSESQFVEEIAIKIKSFKFKKKAPRRKPEICVLKHEQYGLSMTEMPVKCSKLSIEDNYNDDFQAVNAEILKRLSAKNDKGIVLLHGSPGTGKTSYIRFIIGKVRKPVLFLPPNLAANITNPDLMNVLLDNPNSIFVIEDAENLVIDRNRDGNSAVSALLNIADGLLSDCLNIQIICSFNTDLAKVDNALMRKGRLIARYEFKALEIVKAQMLSDRLGNKTKIIRPMTLAEIYNQEKPEFNQVDRIKIGFKG